MRNASLMIQKTIMQISYHLGCFLTQATAEAIHHSLTRAEVEKYIDKMPHVPEILKDRLSGDFSDTKTQWHTYHPGRNGVIGKWQDILTSEQTDEISSRCKSFKLLQTHSNQ